MVIGDNLSHEQRAEFMDLGNEFQSLFTEAPGTKSLAQHYIKLTSDQPVRSRPYPVPYSLKGLGHAILGNFSTDQMVIELTKI